MDIQPQAQQSMSDDQELAKVLAGVSQQADETEAVETAPAVPGTTELGLVAEPATEEPATPFVAESATTTEEAPTATNNELPALPDMSTFLTPEALATSTASPTAEASPMLDSSLEAVKKDALMALRPLVDKLELAPEEKFDTYLLLIRSTDDKDLIAPAEAAAKNIPDDARRAQALLDVVKEIDYLSSQKAA